MRTLEHRADLCVVGGGIAGLCCALSAARLGARVVLVQDRPVLGGNASEEIRMEISGAHGRDNRETGIVEELMLENFYQNPALKYPLWDSVLYETALREPNLTLLLNTSVFDAESDGARLVSVRGWQSNAETFHVVTAPYFADCSGDSILAPLSGAAFRYGREAKRDFGETIPPDEADRKTMGMSCLFQIRETDHPVTFRPKEWAYVYETDDDLPFRDHDLGNNFWWIELGGEWDCIHDTDRCRDELLKIAYGVWDHMKNRGDHGAENWEMDWIGFLPGKRESRRYVGLTTVTQRDVEAGGPYEDVVAYGGWPMDDHFPAGFAHKSSYPTIFHPAPSPWGIPLRALLSANVENLGFAGRNISVTHAALSSCRVMATCGLLGQALGTAVAQAVRTGCGLRGLDVPALQRQLLEDDCFLPGLRREPWALSARAAVSAGVVRNGLDRGDENLWRGGEGDFLEYALGADTDVRRIRLVFDSDLNRDYGSMPCSVPLRQTRYVLPRTLIRAYRLEGFASDGRRFELTVPDNRQRFVRHAVDWRVSRVRLTPLATHGADEFRLFDFEIG
ncbi:MAG: FAD-dependent oxidoreductase [Oscillospiraceae bacterium]|nr:FAD-dependent oxidoreductase [Oscillospiraceae bacterium]